MEYQNPNKNSTEEDLSKPSSNIFGKFQIRGGRFEKGLLLFLILIVVVGLPFSIWKFIDNLDTPFIKTFSEDENTNSTNQLADSTNSEIPVLENLRELDTDGDGLNDYDELYRYRTSPYIQDSDSDSIADNIEVEQGTDPNCPEGNTCSREEIVVDDSTDTSTNTAITEEQLSNMSVEQLRQIMIDSGAPEDEVYKISEEDLRATYQEILKEEGITADDANQDLLNAGTNAGTSDSNIYDNLDYETLFNLGPTEIRQLLVQGGVPESELVGVDDETLLQVYQESLTQNFNQLNQ